MLINVLPGTNKYFIILPFQKGMVHPIIMANLAQGPYLVNEPIIAVGRRPSVWRLTVTKVPAVVNDATVRVIGAAAIKRNGNTDGSRVRAVGVRNRRLID